MLDREIRLTERQIFHARGAVAARVKMLEARLKKSTYAGKPGMLDAVITELSELRELHAELDHNYRQRGREFVGRHLHQ